MKRKINLSLPLYLAFVVFVLTMFGAWVANIVKLVGTDLDSAIDVEFILRIVGIFVAPLGSVMGFI